MKKTSPSAQKRAHQASAPSFAEIEIINYEKLSFIKRRRPGFAFPKPAAFYSSSTALIPGR